MTGIYERRRRWVETFLRQFYDEQKSGRVTIHFDPTGLPCKIEPTPVYKPPKPGMRKIETG
jgi:hypothetical protein